MNESLLLGALNRCRPDFQPFHSENSFVRRASQRLFLLLRLRFWLGRFAPEPGGVTRPPPDRLPERPREGALPVRPRCSVGFACGGVLLRVGALSVPWARFRAGALSVPWARFRAGALALDGFASRFGVGAPLPSVTDFDERAWVSVVPVPSASAAARCLATCAPRESSPR